MTRRIVDLTMPIRDGMPAYPGEPTAAFTPFTTIEADRVAMATVHLFSQLGTHVDAPAHFVAGGTTVDQLDLSHCIGPARVIQLGRIPPGSQIDASVLAAHEESLVGARRVLLATGWSERVGDASYFTDWPVLTDEAVAVFLKHDVVFVGLDTPSPGTDATNTGLHHALLSRGVVLVECLIGLTGLPRDVELVCLPLPLCGLDGSPVRAVALLDDGLPAISTPEATSGGVR